LGTTSGFNKRLTPETIAFAEQKQLPREFLLEEALGTGGGGSLRASPPPRRAGVLQGAQAFDPAAEVKRIPLLEPHSAGNGSSSASSSSSKAILSGVQGVTLRATEQPIDTHNAAGKTFLDILGVFAEFETNLRRERWRASPPPRPVASTRDESPRSVPPR
jgi:hypothetical protein